jgi:glycosyltransferase involved in cell wall biosynthesis
MKSNPKCLVAVPTFGRPEFLPRILACFKRLKHDNKKLVIVNDDSTMRYFMDSDPEIDIVNMDFHLPLAVKRNLFASWDFDIMLPLDDDDLFLPDRLYNHVKEYQEDPYLDFYRNQGMYFICDNRIKHGWSSSYTNSSFTRRGFRKSGGYTNYDMSNQDDQVLRVNFLANCKCKIENRLDTTDFIYQWQGVGNHNTHNTAPVMDEGRRNNMIQRNKDDIVYHKLHVDYETYDNFVVLCEESKNNLEEGVKITISPNGTSISRS